MALLTYNETRPWAKAIREAVVSRRMPPWFPIRLRKICQRSESHAIGDRDLAAWVDAGAPEGNPAETPKPAKLPEDWTIGAPDAIIQMPNEFRVPASGTVEYQYIRVPTMFTEDKWVEKVEVRPGNRAVVHHLVVFAREPGAPFLENLRPGLRAVCLHRRPGPRQTTAPGYSSIRPAPRFWESTFPGALCGS